MLLNAAQKKNPDSVDASLQELINNISSDLEEDGTLEDELVEIIKQAEGDLDVGVVMQNMADRILEVGSDVEVPDLNKVLDQDFDNVVNGEDNCINIANPEQELIGGCLKWQFETNGSVHSSPAIGNTNVIYVGSQNGILYALHQDATIKWEFAQQ